MRLNKYISSSGVTSRRKADELTQNGNVKVNGITIKEMGYQVQEDDIVEVNGQIIKPTKKKVYIALNKPPGYITTVSDEQGRPTVMALVTDVQERIFPVGRLDYETSGLLIMTNDGEFFNELAHPNKKTKKTYRALVSGTVSNERIAKLRNGVDIGGYVTAKAWVKLIKQMKTTAVLEITIQEGKNRQIRKMCKAVGNKVIELQRIAIGDVMLGRLKEGHYRKLTQEEIKSLLRRSND